MHPITPIILTCTTPVVTAFGATTNLVTEYSSQVCIAASQHDYLNHVSSVFWNAMQVMQQFFG